MPLYQTAIGRLLLGWHVLSILGATVLGLMGEGFNLLAPLALWTILALAVYAVRPPFFLGVAVLLALMEEALVYSFGGGLQGKAHSLAQDLVSTMPAFLGFATGWFLALKIQPWSETSLYVGAGLHGFFMEFLTTGLIANPGAVLLLGGPTLFIYASIVLLPRTPLPARRAFSLIRGVGLWFLTLLLMALGGVISSHLSAPGS